MLPVELPVRVAPGRLEPAAARYVVETLRRASAGCLDGTFDALVTAPSVEGRLGNDQPALFPNATIRLCPKINHIALANRPEVYDEITNWWD